MFRFRRRQCTFCGARVPAKQVFRAPDRIGAFVCWKCVEHWEAAGRPCAGCHGAVAGPQEIGAFFDQRTLGHADCGGLRLFAA
jgi:hypothetical protein